MTNYLNMNVCKDKYKFILTENNYFNKKNLTINKYFFYGMNFLFFFDRGDYPRLAQLRNINFYLAQMNDQMLIVSRQKLALLSYELRQIPS